MRMTELRNIVKECDLRGYSKLRKAELIAFLQDNERRTPTPQHQPPQEVPLTKKQHKHRRAKDSKLAKCFVNLNSEINTLKLQMEELKKKISHASRSAHSDFKRKKIRTMKREVDKVSSKLVESEKALESMRVPKNPVSGAPLKLHLPSRPECIEAKIAELNKKISRAKNG